MKELFAIAASFRFFVRNRGFSPVKWRKTPNPHNFGQNNLNPHNFALLRKTIVIWTPERESAREDNRKVTNNDIGTCDFVFVEILGVSR